MVLEGLQRAYVISYVFSFYGQNNPGRVDGLNLLEIKDCLGGEGVERVVCFYPPVHIADAF